MKPVWIALLAVFLSLIATFIALSSARAAKRRGGDAGSSGSYADGNTGDSCPSDWGGGDGGGGGD